MVNMVGLTTFKNRRMNEPRKKISDMLVNDLSCIKKI